MAHPNGSFQRCCGPGRRLLFGMMLLSSTSGCTAFRGGMLPLRPSLLRLSLHASTWQLTKKTADMLVPKRVPKRLKFSPRLSLSRSGPNDDGYSSSSSTTSTSTVASQAALIAGTTIGGGFLALPAATAPCGAAPAALCLIGVWLYLLGGAFSLTNAIFMMKQNNGQQAGDAMQGEISVFSLVRECFGRVAGVLCGLLFLLLVKVTLIAQLSKIGVLLEASIPLMDRRAWTAMFSTSITMVCFVGKRREIENINDALTTAMLVSFASLVALAGGSGWVMDGLKRADWNSLLPSFSSTASSYGSPCAIPIFIQLLIYNEMVPFVSSQLGDEKKVRRAILFGSSVPLIMCLLWSLVALGLVPYEPSAIANGIIYDPLTNLSNVVLSKGGYVGKVFLSSVNILAGSAICTTVIGSILASSQYFDDIITNMIGRGFGTRSTTDKNTTIIESSSASRYQFQKLVTCVFAVAPSTAIANWGSSDLYYRATSFAGEFPCTLLYGLLPALCNLQMRWKHTKNQIEQGPPSFRDVALQLNL